MKKTISCPHCGKTFEVWANPTPTADVVIYEPGRGFVLIKRKNPPHGYALPGGFMDQGEQAEACAIREMKEETGLDVELAGLLGVYSSPDRDPRQHTITTVFVGKPKNPDELKAGDDAAQAAFYSLDNLPSPLAFDHARILHDFGQYLAGKRTLAPIEPLRHE